jgi:hypothetical protein
VLFRSLWRHLHPGRPHLLTKDCKTTILEGFRHHLVSKARPLAWSTATKYMAIVDKITEPGGLTLFDITPDTSTQLGLEHRPDDANNLHKRLDDSAQGRRSHRTEGGALKHAQAYMLVLLRASRGGPAKTSIPPPSGPPPPPTCSRGTEGCDHSHGGRRHNAECATACKLRRASTKALHRASAKAYRAQVAEDGVEYRKKRKARDLLQERADPAAFAAKKEHLRALRAAAAQRCRDNKKAKGIRYIRPARVKKKVPPD